MGIALSALSTLPSPLRALTRWWQHNIVHVELALSDSAIPNAPLTSHVDTLQRLDAAPANTTTTTTTHIPTTLTRRRPLRGNWPFNVRPQAPVRALSPNAHVRPFTEANRSCLPASSSIGGRDAFFASLSADGRTQPDTKVLRRFSDAGSGRLIIAGRMADVCAELDRMAASEELHAR